ncbi:MAG TPA: hypothetical protein VFW33_07605 [Gemmataceae bacterium]|nr:hypothetical protein [Gemmataceae bacterium]
MGKTIIVGDDEPGCGEVAMGLIGLAVLAIFAVCGGMVWFATRGSHPAPNPAINVPAPNPGLAVNPAPAADVQAKTGTLLLRTRVPVIEGAQAWVEVDGRRAAEWPVGSSEVRLALAAGSCRVTVLSIYRGVRRTIFDRPVTVAADDVTAIDVGP